MQRNKIIETMNQKLDEELKSLDEAMSHSMWHVTFENQTIGKAKLSSKEPIEVLKARTTEEAIVKAGKTMGLSKQEAMAARVKTVKKLG